MNKELYISLIARQLSNEMNSSQLENLNSWLSKSKDNANILNEFKTTWAMTSSYKNNVAIDVNSAFNAFAQKFDIPKAVSTPSKSKGYKKYLIGLLFLAFISLGIMLNSLTSNKEVNSKMHPVTTHISSESTITLSPESFYENGKAAELNNSQLDMFNNMLITNNNNQLNSFDKALLPTEKNYAFQNFTGQAFFDFQSDNDMKVIGLDNGNSIIGSNASFNVQNYSEDNNTILDVQSGSVLFVDNNEKTYLVAEGQRAIFDEKSNTLTKVDSPKLNPFKWHKGILVFDNTPIDEAFMLIERFYGVDINIADESPLDDINLTATLSISSSLTECLELIDASLAGGMDIERLDTRNINISNIKGN